ncbi:MAG: hypothetical protein WD356_07170, partial [Pseudomonadales bacterium]
MRAQVTTLPKRQQDWLKHIRACEVTGQGMKAYALSQGLDIREIEYTDAYLASVPAPTIFDDRYEEFVAEGKKLKYKSGHCCPIEFMRIEVSFVEVD